MNFSFLKRLLYWVISNKWRTLHKLRFRRLNVEMTEVRFLRFIIFIFTTSIILMWSTTNHFHKFLFLIFCVVNYTLVYFTVYTRLHQINVILIEDSEKISCNSSSTTIPSCILPEVDLTTIRWNPSQKGTCDIRLSK